MKPSVEEALAALPAGLEALWRPGVASSGFAAVLPADLVALAAARVIPLPALLVQTLPLARAFARPPVSHFRVGAALWAGSGAVYLGANLEIAGLPLSASLHAEQAAMLAARAAGERSVQALAVTAAPCGHCRQFLNELGNDAADLPILTTGRTWRLGDLLPFAFGPADLGLRGAHLLGPSIAPLVLATPRPDPVANAALAAARTAYVPYTNSHAGVALQFAEDVTVTGAAAECAAYNPSVGPLTAALSQAIRAGHEPARIRRAVLVERADAPVSYVDASRATLAALGVPARVFTLATARLTG